MEDYVRWLHEQFRIMGVEPVKMKRVDAYGGISNRSLRVSGREWTALVLC